MSNPANVTILRVLLYGAMGTSIGWLTRAGVTRPPKVIGDVRYYSVKWQVRAFCFIFVLVFGAIGFALPGDGTAIYWLFLLLFLVLPLLAAVYIVIGSVMTDPSTITMKGVFGSRSIPWPDIREIHFNPRAERLELLGGSKKVKIDPRFAVQTILEEVVQRTGLQPIVD